MGLWDAVTSTPPQASKWEVAQYISSVPANPISRTLTPCRIRPSAKLCNRASELARESRPITTVFALKTDANALPIL